MNVVADLDAEIIRWEKMLSQKAIETGIYQLEGLNSQVVGSGNAVINVEYSLEKECWLRMACLFWQTDTIADGFCESQRFKTKEEAVSSMNDDWLSNLLSQQERGVA